MLLDRCNSEQAITASLLAEMDNAGTPDGSVRKQYDALHVKVSTLHDELDACIKGKFELVPWARSRTHYD